MSREKMMALTAEYAEFHEESGKITFTPENWDKYIGVVTEAYNEVLAEQKAELVAEFTYSGWEANGNKLYFKKEVQSQ